jgi:hypothetical protein
MKSPISCSFAQAFPIGRSGTREDAKENGTLDEIRLAADEVEDAQDTLNQCFD